ncbi:MAG: DUF4388 domain-containing protein [Polyangia bacterium]|jgi:hypothetical protein|nr:DUF4388 domain-containing protein [Polyangia bacterium]
MIRYALRFISGKYQGGEFPIHDDREIIIGRSSDLDMVLVEDMVSRKHSKITSTGGELTIEDLGSTNGTFVNGERVKFSKLKDGDRVLIGTSIIKLVKVDEATARKFSERSRSQSFRQQTRHPTASGRPMSGTIEEIPLPDLLQLLSSSRKSGVLAIRSQRGFAKIYMRTGQLYFCSIDDDFELKPQKAIHRVLTWESGAFELQPPDDKSFLEEIKEPTEAILMEGMRLLDEYNRIKHEAPDLDEMYALQNPLSAPLRSLSPAELDVLQLVHNHGQIQTVLDKSPISDADTLSHLIKLLKMQFLRRLG